MTQNQSLDYWHNLIAQFTQYTTLKYCPRIPSNIDTQIKASGR